MPPARRRPALRRAVLYQRQSVEREESISLDLQESANREHCAREGLEVVATYRDEGISGRKWSNRPGAVEAVRMIEAREADVVVVWKWSRLSRNRLDLAVAFDRVEVAGGQVQSSTEPVDSSTASGKLARGMLSEIAAFTSDSIGEGWKEAHASRRARGVPAQGGDRFGYLRVRGEGGGTEGYVIDEGDPAGEHGPPRPSPADALRLAYRWYIDGWGANRIVRELNRRGHRNLIGQPFKRHGLYPLLDAGFAAGLIVHRVRDSGGHLTGEIVHHAGAHPAIIDEDTWRAYVTARAARAGVPPRAANPAHRLSNLMRCGDCGANMTAFSTRGPGTGGSSTYACNAWRTYGSEWRRCVTTTRAYAEREVRAWLVEVAADVERAAAADRKTRRRHQRARADADAAAARVERAEGDLARLAVMRARGEIVAAGYDAAASELEADLEAAKVAAADAERAAITQPAGTAELAAGLVEAWDLLSVEDVNTGLRKLLAGVWVTPPASRRYPSSLRIVPAWEDPPVIVAPPLPDAPLERHPPADGPPPSTPPVAPAPPAGDED